MASAAAKLVVFASPKRRKSDLTSPITQRRMAEIQEMQAQSAEADQKLERALRSLRHDVMHGARIEKGPLRLFFDVSIRYRRAKTYKYRRLRVL